MVDAKLMAEATRLTRQGRLEEATELLRGGRPTGEPRRSAPPPRHDESEPRSRRQAREPRGPAVPDGATWQRGTHDHAAGSRAYAVYEPSRPAGRPALVVMLHGCTQDASDFAVGTRMNEHAEREGFVVLYPEQARSANQNGCWNWFEPHHQAGRGEGAILADMIEATRRRIGCDRSRVFVCGLSAGGAMAANLAFAAPDRIGGALIHSGLPAGAASDLPGALRAMKEGGEGWPGAPAGSAVPLLLLHAEADGTVSARNAEGLAAQALGGAAVSVQSREAGRAGGRGFVRVTETTPEGRVLCETITVAGGGHGWSGGDPKGSHTQRGIDASAEAVRFFQLARA